MGQELQVPSNFKGPAKAFTDNLNPYDDNLADGIGQSYGVLGYKGKTWTLRHRGEKRIFVRKDKSPTNDIFVVIIGQAKGKSKSYYPGYNQDSADGSRPVCMSMDGITPDPEGDYYGKTACAVCPRNEWRTDPKTGRKGKECQDYKRLAVLVFPTEDQVASMGQEIMEPVFLRVPPASLTSLAVLGETMAKKGYPYQSFITRVSFKPEKSWPEMHFEAAQELTNEDAPIILELMKDPIVGRITMGDNPAVKEVQHPALAQTATVMRLGHQGAPPLELPATVIPPASLAEDKQTEALVSVRLGKLGTVTQEKGTPTREAVQETEAGSEASTAPTQQTAEDVGQSNAALDERIAALLKKPLPSA